MHEQSLLTTRQLLRQLAQQWWKEHYLSYVKELEAIAEAAKVAVNDHGQLPRLQLLLQEFEEQDSEPEVIGELAGHLSLQTDQTTLIQN